ncbi:MAG: DUF86 domain-containing protein [Deltaproteobacteria bacterium]|nr:DUF86 domain-containing protein [Deltaproteobacteria bacterium]
MSKEDGFYLRHMYDAICQIELYIAVLAYEEFLRNKLVQDAVIRQLEIIGEASKNISGDLKSRYPETPWKDIAGMRDKLAHHYFGVDMTAVWETATQDLPVLKTTIAGLL